MADFTEDLISRVEHLESEIAYLRQQHLLCRRFHHQNTEQTFLANKVSGHVKWFNVKDGYGFITRNDTHEDVFVHKRGILKNNPLKLKPSVGDGERVEFDVLFVPGRTPEAVNVTGPDGIPVVGSRYATDRYIPPAQSSTNKYTIVDIDFPHNSDCSPNEYTVIDIDCVQCEQPVATSCNSASANISDSVDPTAAPKHEYEDFFDYNSDDFPESDTETSEFGCTATDDEFDSSTNLDSDYSNCDNTSDCFSDTTDCVSEQSPAVFPESEDLVSVTPTKVQSPDRSTQLSQHANISSFAVVEPTANLQQPTVSLIHVPNLWRTLRNRLSSASPSVISNV